MASGTSQDAVWASPMSHVPPHRESIHYCTLGFFPCTLLFWACTSSYELYGVKKVQSRQIPKITYNLPKVLINSATKSSQVQKSYRKAYKCEKWVICSNFFWHREQSNRAPNMEYLRTSQISSSSLIAHSLRARQMSSRIC
jgi:hypothetical protein